MITNERQKTTHSSQFFDQRARSPSGHEELFPPRRLNGRCRFSQGTFPGAHGNGRGAPTANVCDRGVFWKSPLRPRTMLSLRRPAFSAARPDQVNERAQSFAAPCELIRNETR
jgi:hypothetical protein